MQYHVLVSKHAHDFYYQYDMEQISKELEGNAAAKMTVICPEHGEFKVKLSDHYSGTACPKCYKTGRRVTLGKKRTYKPTKKQRDARIAKKKAILTRGRELAARYIIENNIDLPTEIQQMRKAADREKRLRYHMIVCQMIHNFYYEYDLNAWLQIENIRTDKVPIKCPVHGTFFMILSDHYSGANCSKCSAKGNRKTGRKVTLPLEIEETF